MSKLTIYFVLLFLIFGCSKHPKVYLNQLASQEINLPINVNSFLNKGAKVYKSENEFTSLYYIENDSIYFLNLSSFIIDKYFLKESGKYSDYVYSKNLLFFLDKNSLSGHSYKFDTSLKSFVYNDSYDFSKYFHYNSKLAMVQNFFIKDSFLFIKYLKYDATTNFTGKAIYYRFNISKSNFSLIDSLFYFPKSIVNKKRHDKETYLTLMEDSKLFCGFSSDDLIEVFDLKKNKLVKNKEFTKYSDYNKFDYNERKDLGYLRFYDITNERNEAILCIDKFIVILKKLKTLKINEKPKYDIYVFDEDFKILSISSINHTMGKNIFYYKNGFIIVDEQTKFHYYKL